MNRETIENEAYKRYPALHNHIVTEEEVQDAKWEGFVEGAIWMQKQIVNRACEWIFNNYADVYNEEINDCKYGEGWRKDFIKAMEE